MQSKMKASQDQLAKISNLSGRVDPHKLQPMLNRFYGYEGNHKNAKALIAQLEKLAKSKPKKLKRPKRTKYHTKGGKITKKIDYHVYIQSKAWERKKAEFRNSKYSTGRCFVCGATTNIDIHHDHYRNLGKERLGDLVELCRMHHQTLHYRIKIGMYKTIQGAAKLFREEFLAKYGGTK